MNREGNLLIGIGTLLLTIYFTVNYSLDGFMGSTKKYYHPEDGYSITKPTATAQLVDHTKGKALSVNGLFTA